MSEQSESRHCLDLFAGLGGFSAAFADSPDWTVTTVDFESEFGPDMVRDMMAVEPSDLPDADVILAGHPCTVFTHAHNGHHIKDGAPITPKAEHHVAMVHHTLGLIHAKNPDWWFLENPRGNLKSFIGEPTGYVTYCQYGEDYMKPTHLWGEHPPMRYRSCSVGDPCHTRNTDTDGREAIEALPDTAAERAKIPYELSESILEAVESAYQNPPPEQSLLTEAA